MNYTRQIPRILLPAILIYSLNGRTEETAMKPSPKGGFQIIKVEEKSVYARLGLKADDVLKKINGAPVKSQEQVLSLINGTLKSADLEIERSSKTQILHYNYK